MIKSLIIAGMIAGLNAHRLKISMLARRNISPVAASCPGIGR